MASGPITSRSRSGLHSPVRPTGRWGTGLKVTTTSLRSAPTDLPDRSRKGTPAQRQVSTSSVTSASVSVPRAGSTPGSST